MQDKRYNQDTNTLPISPAFTTRFISVSIELAVFIFLKQALFLQEPCCPETGLSSWFLGPE